MSIIAEALKKARKPSLAKKKVSSFEKPKEPEKQKTPKKKHSPAFYLYATFAFTVVVLSLTVVFYTMRSKAVTTSPQTVVEVIEKAPYVAPVVPAKPPVVPVKKELRKPPPRPRILKPVATITSAEVNRSINLSGIMYTQEKPLAVINDAVWAEGEHIGKFEIVDIEKDFVKVVSSGQEFIIKLRR